MNNERRIENSIRNKKWPKMNRDFCRSHFAGHRILAKLELDGAVGLNYSIACCALRISFRAVAFAGTLNVNGYPPA